MSTVFTRSGFCILALVCCSVVGTLQAQTEVVEGGLGNNATSHKISVDFQGLLPEDFVETIKEQAPFVNVLIRPEAVAVQLPHFRLKDVTVAAAIESLKVVSGEKLTVELNETGEYFVIGPNLHRQPDSLEVLNVANYLTEGGQKIDTQQRQDMLMGAISEGMRTFSITSSNMQLKLHEETGLLFVRGSVQETVIVTKIVDALNLATMPSTDDAVYKREGDR